MEAENASLGKRLLAIFYDVLIIFFIIVIVLGAIIILLTVGLNVKIPSDSLLNNILKSFWVLISFFYFGHYWTKRGQTLGMKVWKVKAVTQEGGLMSWGHAIKRYVFALLGLGLLWVVIDKNRLALQDRLSNTRLIKVD